MSRKALIKAAKIAGTWLPTLLLVLAFTLQGLAKFSDSSGWVAAFRGWGYPDWFRMTIGVVELLAAVWLLWRRTAPIGALLIICVMLGGMATHVIFDDGRHMTSGLGPLIVATIVLIIRRHELKYWRDLLRPRATSSA